ncbi:alpha/beta hydrolase [Nonomuraea sp. NPDC049152]|uniref:alpha/beta hydrolase n=1 Tax=Nonomuraea sp. NPDC049152 TaxID=3154350 RepID=UPI0033CF628A
MKRVLTVLIAGSVAFTGLVGGASADAGVSWRECPDRPGAECGVVEVSRDWSAPSGPKVELSVVRRRATEPDARVGTLFYNPGGPGVPAALLVRDYAAATFSSELLRRFDVVGVDPRGVGESKPALRCALPVHDPGIRLFPATSAAYKRLVAHNTAVGRSCRDSTGALLGHIDTVNVARDFDAVRAALGESTVSFFGKSYGSMLGAEYARLFPGRVRTMVLDGAVDHAIPSSRLVTDAARAVEDSFDRFAAWCDRTTTCALHGRDVGRLWDGLVARAEREPINVKGGRPMTADELLYSAYGYLTLFPEFGGQLATAIVEAERGDAQSFAAIRAEALDNRVSTAAYRSILCMDIDPQIRGYRDVRTRMKDIRSVAPHMGGMSEFWDMTVGCAGWPLSPSNPQRAGGIRGVPPVLVVGNTHDPATPLRWARSLSARIEGAGLLVDVGDGHTSYRRSACATKHIDGYLVTGRLPTAGTVCGPERT